MAKKVKEPDKLAQDAAAALAAGMSYGKWKALQSQPVAVEKEIPEGWAVCQWCGKPFKLKTKRPRKYCDYACYEQAYNAKKRQQKKLEAAQ